MNGLLPHEKVRNILASTAEDRGAPGIDNEYGHGVIDAYSAVAEAEFSGATAAQLFVPNAYPGYTRLLDQHVNDSDIWTKEFTVTTDLVYLPIAGTAIIDGTFVVDCLVWFPNFDPNEPDICLFWAELWSPDLELTIEEWTGSSWSEVLPGSGEVTLSECPAYGECGGVGRAEVVHFIPQREGTYRFRVFPFDDGVNAKGGDFDFEISMGVPAPGAGGNATPVVTISSPTDGTTFDDGVMISFAGTADDFEDGDLSASLSWFSDGVDIGTGATLPDMTLAVGSHTITASVTDFGDLLGQDSITVIVNGPLGTNPPAVTIVSPLNGATYAKGGLTFVGSATDVEDDEAGLTDLISWELDEVGIGIGASLLVPDLSLGSHTITALVTDSDGMTDEDTVTFDVIVVAHIADLVDESEPRPRNRWQAAVSVRVEHVDGSLVDGATVTGTWSNGVSGPGSCLTNASGQCKITWPNELKGNAAPVTFTINPFSGISGEDISYQSSANVESSINLDPNGPPPNQPPVAAISAPASGSTFGVFELIYFTESSSDPDGSIMSWHWDYGDYTSTNSQNPIAYYTDDGNYTVTLTVTDDDGATGSASTVIQVGTPPNQSPTASFTVAPCVVDAPCAFTDTSSDPDGYADIELWDWNFGDEPPSTATAANPSHTYAAGGSYTVTLKVTDGDGAWHSTSMSVQVALPSAITLSANSYKVKGMKTVELTWGGANGGNGGSVDITRDGAPTLATTVANTGSYKDEIGKGGGTYTYQVCEEDSITACSNTIMVVF